MNKIQHYEISIERYLDSIACDILSDFQFEQEYQGLFVNDKAKYLANRGFNCLPDFSIN